MIQLSLKRTKYWFMKTSHHHNTVSTGIPCLEKVCYQNLGTESLWNPYSPLHNSWWKKNTRSTGIKLLPIIHVSILRTLIPCIIHHLLREFFLFYLLKCIFITKHLLPINLKLNENQNHRKFNINNNFNESIHRYDH